MKIRRDSVFVSSVLFTVALLYLLPICWSAALAGRDKVALEALDAGYQAAAQTMGYLGVASMAVVFIGLTITWTGYVKRVRSAWFVMFMVVWVWAFPLFVLPLFKHTIALTFSEWLYSAIYQPGPPRIWAESVLIFSLMVIALLLPMKSFFIVREKPEPIHRPSLRLIGIFAMTVLVTMTALLAWIHSRVYEITPAELNSWQQFVVPPPPPRPY